MNNNELYPLNALYNRLNKIGINVTFTLNVPWIYIDTINGIKVKEKTPDANHGFNIAWLPVRNDKPFVFTNTTEMFDLIRSYLHIKK
jgi:hypothetical protein